ncbi:MAG: cupin-like domain-containing protein [Thermaurantimonas sp.]|uniref:cupin-like domain-containing protein n=1 Tax=Thermaurantimonas sp. TaxID=2681568 RepID=UPI0039190E26
MELVKTIEIESINDITKTDFVRKYYKPQRPVVVRGAARTWPAFEKWNLEYIKSKGRDKVVPLYDNKPVDASKKVNEPVAWMKLDEYIDYLLSGKNEYRIFLYNFLKEIPELQKDIIYPDLGVRLFKSLPMLFFGGAGSKVFMHYDIDLANIFHYHFVGTKTAILAAPDDTPNLYHVPFSTISLEEIDFENPDIQKYPALKKVTFYKATLQHGDMLYMPEGWWHYMIYNTNGFSLSLRGIPTHPKNLLEAVNNVFVVRNFDNAMRKLFGQDWIQYKTKKAYERVQERELQIA